MQTLCKHLKRTNMCEDLCSTANYRVGSFYQRSSLCCFAQRKKLEWGNSTWSTRRLRLLACVVVGPAGCVLARLGSFELALNAMWRAPRN